MNGKRIKALLNRVVFWLLLAIIFVYLVFPFYWAISSSLKTEAELLQVARMKGLESGVASIYRTVQGLDTEETDFARKQEMLTLLFEANVELRKKIAAKP